MRSIEAEAKEDFSDYASVRHPLIQATNVVEEYEALEALGFLDTGVAEYCEQVEGEKDTVAEIIQGIEKKDSGKELIACESESGRFLQKVQQETAYEKAGACIVQINMGEYYGSGVIWDLQDENIVIVSNTHLLQNGQSGMITFGNGVTTQGTVIGISDMRDIGFLQVPLSSLEREDWLSFRFADKDVENYQSLLPGDEIFVIGSASGTGKDFYEGTIGNVSYYFPEFQSDMLYGYCQAVPGMSGGGTFDKEGHFIGMLTAGTDNAEIASLPLEIMIEEYEKVLKYP
ncbi:MAG: trypsin-like peptidase domain-containing protein [Lachnospiraceae bacterium]|nr:trypsin-like peptidase domain-containing protein [Lachnospiraceae bacterium]